MKSIRAKFLRPDILPDVNHKPGMEYQIVLNIRLYPELNKLVVHICVHNSYTIQHITTYLGNNKIDFQHAMYIVQWM